MTGARAFIVQCATAGRIGNWRNEMPHFGVGATRCERLIRIAKEDLCSKVVAQVLRVRFVAPAARATPERQRRIVAERTISARS